MPYFVLIMQALGFLALILLQLVQIRRYNRQRERIKIQTRLLIAYREERANYAAAELSLRARLKEQIAENDRLKKCGVEESQRCRALLAARRRSLNATGTMPPPRTAEEFISALAEIYKGK